MGFVYFSSFHRSIRCLSAHSRWYEPLCSYTPDELAHKLATFRRGQQHGTEPSSAYTFLSCSGFDAEDVADSSHGQDFLWTAVALPVDFLERRHSDTDTLLCTFRSWALVVALLLPVVRRCRVHWILVFSCWWGGRRGGRFDWLVVCDLWVED